jgi:hypothetical protein
MDKRYCFILTLLFFSFCTVAKSNEQTLTEHFSAYNSANTEALAITLHDDIKEYSFPNTLKSADKTTLMNSWSSFIKSAKPSSKIINKIVLKDKIVTEEVISVQGTTIQVIGIYEFKDSLIYRVTFIE